MTAFKLLYATMFAAMVACACQDQATVGNDARDESAIAQVQHALISPDQDLKDFPPWIWPYIHPTDVLANILDGREVKVELASKLMTQSAEALCECSVSSKPSFANVVELVNIGFDMQYGTVRLAQIRAGGAATKDSLVISGDDVPPCGNEPRPWPIPWPWLKLIYQEADVFLTVLPKLYDFNREQTAILQKQISTQIARFEKLAN